MWAVAREWSLARPERVIGVICPVTRGVEICGAEGFARRCRFGAGHRELVRPVTFRGGEAQERAPVREERAARPPPSRHVQYRCTPTGIPDLRYVA